MDVPAHIAQDAPPGLQPAKQNTEDGIHIAAAVFADAVIMPLEAGDAVLTRGLDGGDNVGLVDRPKRIRQKAEENQRSESGGFRFRNAWVGSNPLRGTIFPDRRNAVTVVDQAASFTLFNGGVGRNAIATRFQALIAITAAVRSTSSFSEKWRRASS